MPDMENPPGANRGAMTDQAGGQFVDSRVPRQLSGPPSTFAEAAVAFVDDVTRCNPYFTWGYLRGHLDCLDVLGVDVQPEPDPEWLARYFAEQRQTLAERRAYKTPARTAAQIAAEVAYSWRQAERRQPERRAVA